MNRFSDAIQPRRDDDSEGSTASAATPDLSSLFNYPSLGRLLDGTDLRPLAEMQARLRRTHGELERVVRQGSKEDAARAARAVRAYDATLELLEQLERLRRESGK